MLHIHKVRLGFATSSSSIHSIIITNNEQPQDNLHFLDGEYQYGWGNFVLASKEAKLDYLATLLFMELKKILAPDLAVTAVNSLFNANINADAYVDSRSCISFPATRRRQPVDIDFANAFREFLLRDDVVVLGGNDNEDDNLEELDGVPLVLPPRCDHIADYIARHDEQYNFWTLFNTKTGAQMRFSFDDPGRQITKSSTPELLDLKITDYCPYNCVYCYQDSGPTGVHADLHEIAPILHELGVLEVAIGGGEPTTHPSFNQLIDCLYYYGITVNFTTNNIDWFHFPKNRKILQRVGRIGITGPKCIEWFRDIIDPYNLAHKFAVHIIDQTLSYISQGHLLDGAYHRQMPVIFLGFKRLGRGASFPDFKRLRPGDPFPVGRRSTWGSTWVEALNNYTGHLPNIGVDSKILEDYAEDIERMGVYPITTAGLEGQFSAYLDLVDQTMARSSYEPETTIHLESLTADAIKEAFASF